MNDDTRLEEIDLKIEEDNRLGKPLADILYEELSELIDLARSYDLSDEDILDVLSRVIDSQTDRDRGKFKIL